jgi:hypothetical protein
MAKILAVSANFSSKETLFDTYFSIVDAKEIFDKFQNKRAVGICYQNLGCLSAKLQKDYKSALDYINAAIEIQESVLEEFQYEDDHLDK